MDSLYTNTFVTGSQEAHEPQRARELHNYQLRQSLAEHAPDHSYTHSIGQHNHVIDEDGKLRELEQGVIMKEQRRILAINSNQRRFFLEELLKDHSPEDYKGYISSGNYQRFVELYSIAMGTTSTIQTYEEYIKKNSITLTQVTGDPQCRALIRNLLSSRSARATDNSIASINDTLLDILANIVTTAQGLVTQGTVANELNVLAMTGTAYNPQNYWRPFRFTSSGIKIVRYNDQHPNSYTIVLPSILKHVKSIRLISTEIPNTVNNITERNNLLILKLRCKTSGKPAVRLDPVKSAFNFIMVQLDIGVYDMNRLVLHMQEKINGTIADLTNKKYGDVFSITWNQSSGAVRIECKRPDLEFHLKFYSEMTDQIDITNPGVSTDVLGTSPGTTVNYCHDLWYMLGFPWPYEIDETGADKYTGVRTNVVNYGLHSVFSKDRDDIFQRDKVQGPAVPHTLNYAIQHEQYLTESQYTELNVYRTYRYPDVTYRYIYLVLKGYKSISHVNQHNMVITFTDNDIFAKVLLNAETGRVAYNTFVSNPLIFPNAIDKIELLEVQWIDETGALVDFSDVDHSFTLEVIQYITQVESTGYDTTLGTIDKKSYPEYLRGSSA